MCRGNRS